jgi:hypothetical protein
MQGYPLDPEVAEKWVGLPEDVRLFYFFCGDVFKKKNKQTNKRHTTLELGYVVL